MVDQQAGGGNVINEIPTEKFFEMYGRVSFERDLMREQLQQQSLRQQAAENQTPPDEERTK